MENVPTNEIVVSGKQWHGQQLNIFYDDGRIQARCKGGCRLVYTDAETVTTLYRKILQITTKPLLYRTVWEDGPVAMTVPPLAFCCYSLMSFEPILNQTWDYHTFWIRF